MRTWWPVLLLAAVLVVGLLVVNADREPPAASKEKQDKVALAPADFAGLDKALADRKGSVVLVECWATWCGPCRQRFPHLVELHDRHADRGLACVSLALEEDPDADRPRALSFLKHHGATFTNLIWTERTPAGARGLEERLGYGGAIPHVALFNRAGERVLAGNGGDVSPKMLERAVEDALK